MRAGRRGVKKAPRLPGQEPGGTPGIPEVPQRSEVGFGAQHRAKRGREARGRLPRNGRAPLGPAAGGLWGPEGS